MNWVHLGNMFRCANNLRAAMQQGDRQSEEQDEAQPRTFGGGCGGQGMGWTILKIVSIPESGT